MQKKKIEHDDHLDHDLDQSIIYPSSIIYIYSS